MAILRIKWTSDRDLRPLLQPLRYGADWRSDGDREDFRFHPSEYATKQLKFYPHVTRNQILIVQMKIAKLIIGLP